MAARPKANRLDNSPSRRRYLPVVRDATLIPDAPASLNRCAATIWTQVWQLGSGAYADTDSFIIERYASLQARRLALLETLSAEGEIATGSQGQSVAHPAARLLADIETRLTGLEDRLGLNPEARVRLGIATVEAQSKLDEFLSEGNGATWKQTARVSPDS